MVQRALDLQHHALVRTETGALHVGGELLDAQLQSAREVQLAAVADREQAPVAAEIDQRYAAVLLLVKRGDVALRGFRNIDHRERNARFVELADALPDDFLAREHRVKLLASTVGAA